MNEQKHTGGQKPVCVTHEKLLSEGTRQSFTEPSRESVSYTHIQPHTHICQGVEWGTMEGLEWSFTDIHSHNNTGA